MKYIDQAARHLHRHGLPTTLAPALVEAIEACRAGVYDHAIEIPSGWTRAWDLVERAHAELEVDPNWD